ncbi:hypothetical protein GCM10022409_14620 [Hymenobacter glaciei]|uniref:DUF5117 domain-containing protein n=1 Tax=Hymenobacter glaciei TaxID=877209 RepID=A0ABP7TUH5_9BACT
MKQTSTFLLLIVASLLAGPPARAQVAGPEARLPAAAETLRREYASESVNYPYLYNGPEYADYTRKYHTSTGHQFFLKPEMMLGSAHYNDREFSNVRLQYDLLLDQVVLSQPGNPLKLRFIDEKVRAFSVDGHQFVRLAADSANADIIRTGYYELLADGPVQVLARRTKAMYEHLNKPYVDVSFSETTRLYMQKAGRYYAVHSKGAALRLFANHSKEMQQYLKEHRLSFNQAHREESLVELTRYYNGLPTS